MIAPTEVTLDNGSHAVCFNIAANMVSLTENTKISLSLSGALSNSINKKVQTIVERLPDPNLNMIVLDQQEDGSKILIAQIYLYK